ncbi:AMP-binding protein [Caballeronia sp. LZ032]|uniref:class I adenylate-forming enzyme family protein n=1 Tax=Caballeronia sp. LZ032 TaxID=3038565 RepID=UPI00285EB683|nr:AMP-binding protein [Caballeronia sp. LZ032]MDR5881716.1 AMP-binding protein [Caballeronia sp. LZ032]
MDHQNQAAFRSYVEILLDQLLQHAGRPVLRYRDTDIDGRTLRASIFRHARALETFGIGRGSLVALFAPNCPDALAIHYAANLLGAASMFLPAAASVDDRAALLKRIRPALLVAFAETAHLVPEDVGVRVVHVGTGLASMRLDFRAALQSAAPLPSRARPCDLAMVASSGGSTGVPKASLRSFAAYSAMVGATPAPQRRQLVNGALAYLSQVLVDQTLTGGGTVILRPGFDAADTLATIEAERITDLLLVEPQLFETMDHPDARTRDLSSLRSIVHIGGSAPAVLLRRALARFGPVLTHMYGASEAGLVSVLTPSDYLPHPAALESSGRVRNGVDLRLRRADGLLAAPGESGRIEVKSASVAQGYRNQPVDSALKFCGGWCMTGDVGMVDAQGFLHVLGRATEVIDMGGVPFGPAQIEASLCALHQVRYAVAVSNDYPASSKVWNVLVMPWPGLSLNLALCRRAIELNCGRQVAEAVHLMTAPRVPLTEQGKVDRGAIGRLALAVPDDTMPGQEAALGA